MTGNGGGFDGMGIRREARRGGDEVKRYLLALRSSNMAREEWMMWS